LEINDFTLGLLGTIGTSLVTTIGVLWYKLGKTEEEKDLIRDKFQEKIESLLIKVTELMVTSTSQTTTFTNAIKEITESMARMKEEFLRGKGQ